MFILLKEALTSKNFYTTKYKSISRIKTVLYILFISFLFSLLVTPVLVTSNYSEFLNFKKEIKNLPNNIEFTYASSSGLNSNQKTPIVINISEESILIIDTKAQYNKHTLDKEEIILRKKGFLVYQEGDLVEQSTYGLPNILNFSLTGKEIKNEFNNITSTTFFLVSGTVGLLLNILIAITNLIIVSLIFSTAQFIYLKISKVNTKYLLVFKQMLFLSTFYLLGLTVLQLTFGYIPFADLIFMGIGYFWLIRQ